MQQGNSIGTGSFPGCVQLGSWSAIAILNLGLYQSNQAFFFEVAPLGASPSEPFHQLFLLTENGAASSSGRV